MHKDTIVGIAGATILVAAMVGVFWYEGTQGASSIGARTFQVAFAETQVNGPSLSGTANEGQAVEETVRITTGNLTTVRFTLVWTDTQGEPDSFDLEVTGPDGSGFAAQKASGANAAGNGKGEIVVEFEIGDVPGSTTMGADSAEEAESRALAQSARSLGHGEWTVKITLTEAGDAAGLPLPGGLPGNPIQDTAQAFELNVLLGDITAEATS